MVDRIDPARLAATGFHLVRPPRQPETGDVNQDWIADLRGPDGNLIQLRQPHTTTP